MDSIEKLAGSFAIKAHMGQTRRDGKTAYIEHCVAVADRVTGNVRRSVALLHDVIEKTKFTAEDMLQAGIPLCVVGKVLTLSYTCKDLEDDDDKYFSYIWRIKKDADCLAVKLADIQCNMGDTPTRSAMLKYGKALVWLLQTN